MDTRDEIREAGTIEGWNDLSKLVDKYFKSGWIWRGVGNAAHGLRPRIGRPGARRNSTDGTNRRYSQNEEKRLLRQFKREGQVKFEWKPSTDLEWMILGQHHFMPTRLLDWSESLIVAAYFAVDQPVRGGSAAIYGVLPPPRMDAATDPFDVDLGKGPWLVRPPHITPRITAQQGVLTLHTSPSHDWESNAIHQWTIPAKKCFTIKGKLNFSGIHAASLFPDSTDKHTEHLGWLYKWGRLS
jgi:hypothetical protein